VEFSGFYNDLYIFCSNKIIADGYIRSDNKGGESIAPLYLYPENNRQQTIEKTSTRTPNLNPEIIKQIENKLGLNFVPEKNKDTELVEVAPIDILDYIYAVLHSPTYREKYKEFLKIDFPRVPYPSDKETFWKLVKLGGEIRQIHLLESPITDKYITQYPIDGSNIVVKPTFKDGKVYINETQYFNDVPETAWNFYIGGYQPAQKWLKDRKDRKLEFEDILHYQKIIVALSETDRLMREVDEIEI
jgi:predicted helicase